MNKTAFILAMACALLGGCRSRQHISRANIAVVERAFALSQEPPGRSQHDPSVTAKEVESVLGPPHRIDPPETALRDVEVYRYSYMQDNDLYQFHFFNGRLIKIEYPSPTPAPAAPPSDKKS